MTTNIGLIELAARLGDARAADGLTMLLDLELASISLFEDTFVALKGLKDAGIRIWVASNLAAPYGPPVRRLLDELVSGYSFSFEVGALKPDPKIFAHVCDGLSLSPSQVLMVGDSKRSDIAGAQAFGMPAIWLRRDHPSAGPGSVKSLLEIAECRTNF